MSQLALSLKPRYHFSGFGGIAYERPPYRSVDAIGRHLICSDHCYAVYHFIYHLSNFSRNDRLKIETAAGCEANCFLLNIVVFCVRRNHRVLQGSAEHVTRFIALANVGNKEKQKVFSVSLELDFSLLDLHFHYLLQLMMSVFF